MKKYLKVADCNRQRITVATLSLTGRHWDRGSEYHSEHGASFLLFLILRYVHASGYADPPATESYQTYKKYA
jgi:hypothetical protein